MLAARHSLRVGHTSTRAWPVPPAQRSLALQFCAGYENRLQDPRLVASIRAQHGREARADEKDIPWFVLSNIFTIYSLLEHRRLQQDPHIIQEN